MYNNSSETVSLKTPVHLQVFLRPWFDKKCLQEGLDLIREGKIHHFFFYRYAAAGLLNGFQPLHILFTTTAKISQGFTLHEGTTFTVRQEMLSFKTSFQCALCSGLWYISTYLVTFSH